MEKSWQIAQTARAVAKLAAHPVLAVVRAELRKVDAISAEEMDK